MITNNGLAHGWGYVLSAQVINKLHGFPLLERLTISVGDANLYSDILPIMGKSSYLKAIFHKDTIPYDYNPGVSGFVDSLKTLWVLDTLIVPDALSLDDIEAQLTAYKVNSAVLENGIFQIKNGKLANSFVLKKNTPIRYGDVTGVVPKLAVRHAIYSDSVLLNKDIKSFLAQLSEDLGGKRLNFYSDFKAVKSPPIVIIVFDTSITIIESKCEYTELDLNELVNILECSFSNENQYVIAIQCGGPIEWKSVFEN